MSNFQFYVVRSTKIRKGFGNYEYDIFEGKKIIARYWHDFRCDDHGIDFIDGIQRDFPFGIMTDFLIGGGPKPLALSDSAIIYLSNIFK